MDIKKLKKISIIFFAAFLFTDIFKVRALADDPIVDIFPSNGSVTTKIYLQIRCGNMQDGILYMYWDGLPLLRGVPQDTEFGPIRYDLTFYPPTDSPFSDKGEHIIKIEIFYEIIVEEPRVHEEGREYAVNLSFVIEDETTNGDTSTEYEELQDEYYSLLEEYNELSQVQDEYYSLLEDYNELHQDYLVSQDLVIELQGSVAELQERITELENQLASESNRQIPGFPLSSITIGITCAIMILLFARAKNLIY